MENILIIGASYAGLYAVKKLSTIKNVNVTIFDKNLFHYIQVESYEFVATTYKISDVTIDINQYIDSLNSNIKFCNEEVVYFDSNKKEIVTKNSNKYLYDYLIIATGSLTNFPIQVPNIQKYSIGIKTLQKASKVQEAFSSIIHQKMYENSSKENKEFNLVIGGAGLSGIEVASQMAWLLKNKSSLINTKSSKINIIIVDGMKTVLPNMDERLIKACQDRLQELDIKVYLGSFIKDVDENKIYLANDTVVDYDYFIFTGGIKAVSIPSEKTYERNKLNQYIVEGNLKLKSESNIFAIGDAAEFIQNDVYTAPTAQIAIKSGEYVANHIKNNLEWKHTEDFKFTSNGILISLGGSYAIGLLNDKFFVKGYISHLIKKFVTFTHKLKLR